MRNGVRSQLLKFFYIKLFDGTRMQYIAFVDVLAAMQGYESVPHIDHETILSFNKPYAHLLQYLGNVLAKGELSREKPSFFSTATISVAIFLLSNIPVSERQTYHFNGDIIDYVSQAFSNNYSWKSTFNIFQHSKSEYA